MDNSVGLLGRQKVEARLKECEKQQLKQASGTGKGRREAKKFEFKKEQKEYNTGRDFMFGQESQEQNPEALQTTPAGKKRKLVTAEDMETTPGEESGKKKKKKKKSLETAEN